MAASLQTPHWSVEFIGMLHLRPQQYNEGTAAGFGTEDQVGAQVVGCGLPALPSLGLHSEDVWRWLPGSLFLFFLYDSYLFVEKYSGFEALPPKAGIRLELPFATWVFLRPGQGPLCHVGHVPPRRGARRWPLQRLLLPKASISFPLLVLELHFRTNGPSWIAVHL